MRTKTRRTLMIIATAIVATALLVGGGVAVAAQASSDDELAQMADRIRSKDAFVTTVAKELGTTAAKLEAAIVAAANARIDAAEQAGSLSAADADLLRETVADEPHAALRIAEGATVAKELGTTEAKLDAAWAKAAKQEAIARVDDALADGRITKATADELKSRIEQMTFPGFGERGPGRGGHGMGGGGPLGQGHDHGGAMPFGHGPGGGWPGSGQSSSSSSSTQPSAVF